MNHWNKLGWSSKYTLPWKLKMEPEDHRFGKSSSNTSNSWILCQSSGVYLELFVCCLPYHVTFPETNQNACENRRFLKKGKFIFQPSIFRCKLLVPGMVFLTKVGEVVFLWTFSPSKSEVFEGLGGVDFRFPMGDTPEQFIWNLKILMMWCFVQNRWNGGISMAPNDCILENGLTNSTHSIHVWYIYLHLPYKSPKM